MPATQHSSAWLSLPYTNGLEYVVDAPSRPAGHDLAPGLLRNPFGRRQDAPVRARLGLEPLEVVNLVPHVLLGPGREARLGGCHQVPVRGWELGEAHALAVFDDGARGAPQVDVDAVAVVHAQLAAGDHEDAVLEAGDMGGPVGGAAAQQARGGVGYGQAGEGGAAGGAEI